VPHHVDHDLDNRSQAEYHDSEADDGDSGPCAASQCEHQERDKHDQSRQMKPHRRHLTYYKYFTPLLSRALPMKMGSFCCTGPAQAHNPRPS
jgi:hypothetical protein